MTIIVPASTWQPLARRLADELDADGDLHTPGWRDALLTVPRHEFIPRYYLQDREARPLRWTTHEPHDTQSTQQWLPRHLPQHLAHRPGRDHRTTGPRRFLWCEITRQPDATGRYPVREAGPTPLWSNIETAWNRWRELGAPAWHEFGLTATPSEHHIWHLNPHDGPRWRLPVPTPGTLA